LARQLAEIGVILLMFGIGLHFSLDNLLSVKAIALPGALGQIALVTVLGVTLTERIGWPIGTQEVVFGLALSVASTVVVLRNLRERRLIETERGRIAVGWLIVQDLATIFALMLLPAFAHALGEDINGTKTGESGPFAFLGPYTFLARAGASVLESGGEYRRSGSAALSIAHVAQGRLDGYVEMHLNAWDVLAGMILVTEAGGWTNDFLADGGLSRGNLFVATTPHGGSRILFSVSEDAATSVTLIYRGASSRYGVR
jgi:Sodium/hydrogen exchanger family/Inositol monophosphatase family